MVVDPPTGKPVNVIFEGALSRGWSMVDVLRAVSGVENQRFGVLRINAPNNVNGRIAIADGAFIVGAVMADGTAQGYEALRPLLSAASGNFAYLDTEGKLPPEFDESLYLSLEKVMSTLPGLPAQFKDLFDEKSLLDKLFGGEGDGLMPNLPKQHKPVIQPEQKQQQFVAKALQVVSGAAESSSLQANRESGQWKNGSQSFLGDSVTSGQIRGSVSYYEQEDTAAHRLELGRLRSQDPEALPWYRAILQDSFVSKQIMTLIIVAIFLLSLIATLCVTAFVNRPN